MRKIKRERRLLPFVSGALAGYGITLVLCVPAAFILLITDSAESLSGALSTIIMAASCFLAGRISGKQKRRDGLKTGFLCGALYFLPLMITGLILSEVSGILLIVKAALCLAFGTVGGVVGVNAQDT